MRMSRRRRWPRTPLLRALAALLVGLGWAISTAAENQRRLRPRVSPQSPAAATASQVVPLSAKLDQAMQNDQRILARFDEIMAELQVVKIRVLRRPQNP